MESDSNPVANYTRWIDELNDAFKACRGEETRWWGYGVSDGTFQLIVEPPLCAKIVVVTFWTSFISGPTRWAQNGIRAELDTNGSTDPMKWEFHLFDEEVDFRVVARTLHWARNINVLNRDYFRFWRPGN